MKTPSKFWNMFICEYCGTESLTAKTHFPYFAVGRSVALCKECIRLANAHHNYGITPPELKKLYEVQEGKCAICECLESDSKVGGVAGGTYRFCIDHDHDTGMVRSLLCNRCNTAISRLRESKSIAVKAVAYLEKHCGI